MEPSPVKRRNVGFHIDREERTLNKCITGSSSVRVQRPKKVSTGDLFASGTRFFRSALERRAYYARRSNGAWYAPYAFKSRAYVARQTPLLPMHMKRTA